MAFIRPWSALSAALLCLCFSEATPTYDQDAAALLVGYAQVSYCQNVENWECGAVCRGLPALSNITVVEDPGTNGRAYIGYEPNSDIIIISFRGTVATSFRNWLSDLTSFKPVESPYCPAAGCKIGKGFSNAYKALREAVIDALRSLKKACPKAKVHVTGHSLGAAIAMVCASDLKNSHTDPDTVITFGCPRTGNQEFARYLSDTNWTQWRVTHHRDPVVHFPTDYTKMIGFHHVPTEVFYTDSTGLAHKLCDGTGEDLSCSHGMVPLPVPTDHLYYLDRKLGSHHCPE